MTGNTASAARAIIPNTIAPSVRARATICCMMKLRFSSCSLAMFNPVISALTPALALHSARATATSSAKLSDEWLLLA